MSTAEIVSLSTMIALIMLTIAMGIAVIRVVIGPTLADRVLALDLLTVVAMGFVGAIAIRTGLTLYLDIAISLALLGFLATALIFGQLLLGLLLQLPRFLDLVADPCRPVVERLTDLGRGLQVPDERQKDDEGDKSPE